jgi:hypothetical protein
MANLKQGGITKFLPLIPLQFLEGGLLISRITKDVSKINLLAGLLEVDENMA